MPMAAQVAVTPPALAAPAAAGAVVRRYYAAVSAHDWPTAHAIWSGGRSLAAMRRGYADTARVRVSIGPITSDAGMGQIHATVPVIVDAQLHDGARQRFAGRFVLDRVNDVDGSTLAQRRWHIVSARLHATRPPG